MNDLKLAKSFLKRNPVKEHSAARYSYSLLSMPDVEQNANAFIEQQGMLTAEVFAERKRILDAAEPNQLLRLLRSDLNLYNKSLLLAKALEHEEVLTPEIQRRILTTQMDVFIENALRFFVSCKADSTDWLVAHFDDIRNPYARSTMCLVLGFRADESVIPLLMRQFDSLRSLYPDESFEQAPLLALHELCHRFQTG